MALVFQNAIGLKIGFWKYLRAGKDISNQTPQRFKKNCVKTDVQIPIKGLTEHLQRWFERWMRQRAFASWLAHRHPRHTNSSLCHSWGIE